MNRIVAVYPIRWTKRVVRSLVTEPPRIAPDGVSQPTLWPGAGNGRSSDYFYVIAYMIDCQGLPGRTDQEEDDEQRRKKILM